MPRRERSSDRAVAWASVRECHPRGGIARALDDGREDLRVLAFWWVAVRVDHEVVIAVVRRLEWRPRFDVDELASGYVVALGRVVDIHRQDAAEDDEGLLLMPVAMTATLCAGFVAPHI